MPHADDLGRLDPADWDRLQDLAERFEDAWQSGEPVPLAEHLPPADDPLRPVALAELIKLDLEFRHRHNCPIALETYAQLFPELGPPPALAPHLIHEEYSVRTRFGDKPKLTEYQSRFPKQFDRVLELVQEQPARGGERAVPARNVRPHDTMSDLIIQSGEGYRFIERIGAGTFAEVYRGEAPGGIPVGIKRLFQPMTADEAQRELHALDLIKTFRHPFLLAVQAFWVSGGRLFIAMELADGNLRDRLAACRERGLSGVPAPELLAYITQAAQALDFLHSRDVLHRDIKPENILVLQGFAKIADFGLARTAAAVMESAGGSGTPRYMAPEVWTGAGSPRSDQYGLALCFAELRQGRFPFAGDTTDDVRRDALAAIPDLTDMSDPEQTVLLQALAKSPAERFASCQAFAEALRVALAANWQ
jgi:protein kinase-like protein